MGLRLGLLALTLGIPACGSTVTATRADSGAPDVPVPFDAPAPPDAPVARADVFVVPDIEPTDPSRIVSMSISFTHECAAFSDGHVRCRGINNYGQLGIGSADDSIHPSTVVPGLRGARQVVAADYATLALLEDGSVRAWGDGSSNVLGLAAPPDVCNDRRCALRPAPVVGAGDAVSLVASTSGACVLRRDRALVCWGSVWLHLSGHPTPEIEDDRGDIRDLGMAAGLVVVRRSDGSLLPGPGRQALGETFDPTWELAAGTGGHLCATLPDRSVRCWGSNTYGQLGSGTMMGGSDPTPRDPGLGPVRSVVRGGYHTCAIRDDGTVWCWGHNEFGQAGVPRAEGEYCQDGNRKTPCVWRPRRVPGIDAVEALYLGNSRTCALRTDQTLWCWGASFQSRDAASPVPTRADW
jgi:alpha-tubulin suppressor-like RCC1 family protein